MAREADSLVPVNAGIEVYVAATKSYVAQLMAFYALALHLAEIKESADKEEIKTIKNELLLLPQKIELLLTKTDKIDYPFLEEQAKSEYEHDKINIMKTKAYRPKIVQRDNA